jgi:thiamine biosynthesis protein ThiS
MIRAMVNGEGREMESGETLLDLVEKLELKPDRLAIELDRKIVKPVLWAQTRIRDGAEIEIVHFVGGG